MIKNYPKLALADRYLILQLVPIWLFSLTICTVFSELIGISFEQVKFMARDGLSANIVAQVHYYKLPAFLSLSLPLSLLMATTIAYSKLSAKNEIVALQSFGMGLYRLLVPTIAIACIATVFMFSLNEFVVPSANYKTAMILEREWGVDRHKLAKYNKQEIVYQKFSDDRNNPTLEFLFFADYFDGRDMNGITLLKYIQSQLREIITAKAARWDNKQQSWLLFSGRRNVVDVNNNTILNQEFNLLSETLTKDILDYASHHRDPREMSIIELYRRLNLVNDTNDLKTARQLKIAVQERYALPFSCLVFAFLGSVLGIVTGAKTKSSGSALAAIAIFLYYAAQFLAVSFASAGLIPIFLGVWFSNLLGLLLGYRLINSNIY